MILVKIYCKKLTKFIGLLNVVFTFNDALQEQCSICPEDMWLRTKQFLPSKRNFSLLQTESGTITSFESIPTVLLIRSVAYDMKLVISLIPL